MFNKISYSEVIKKDVFLSQLCLLLWCSISPCQLYHSLNVNGNLGIHPRFLPSLLSLLLCKNPSHYTSISLFISSLALFLTQPQISLQTLTSLASVVSWSPFSIVSHQSGNSKTIAWNIQALYNMTQSIFPTRFLTISHQHPNCFTAALHNCFAVLQKC